MSRFTRGPWVASGFDVEQGLTTICTTWPDAHGIEPYGVENNQIAEANARLISAAPDLVEALKELLAAETTQMPSYGEGTEAQDAWAERKALARLNAAATLTRALGEG